MDAFLKAKEIIRESKSIVFFGGAGVSTASGIPDFRSPDGLYNTMKDAAHPPEYYFSREFYLEDPDGFADFTRTCYKSYQVKPSAAHEALAKLEKMGKLDCVITQNIDKLHQRAGSKKVLEIHGNMQDIYCPSCGYRMDTQEFMKARGRVPCPVCGDNMRADVCLYGEVPNQSTFRQAVSAIAKCDCLIVGGSSLVVYPAAGLLNYYRGHKLILINREVTPADSRADLVLHGDIAKILPDLIEGIGPSGEKKEDKDLS